MKAVLRPYWQDVSSMVRRILTAAATEPWVKPLSVAVGSHLALYILIIFFVGLFPGEPADKPDFWGAMAQWDGEWYLRIARRGYEWQGPETQSAVAFFPLYPALGKMVGLLVGNVRWGLLIVTNIGFALYLYFLYRLTKMDFDVGTAERAIIYAAVYPGAFFLAAFYAETVTFALAVAAFYYARRGVFWLAIALGFMCALSRLPGVAIFFPVTYEYWRQRGLRWQAIALGIIPLGTALFAAYLWQISGDPLNLFTYQNTAWFRSFTPPWETVRLALDRATWSLQHYVVSVGLLDAGTILLFLGLSVFMLFRMPPPYWLFALPILFGALATTVDPDKAPPTASITRFLMSVFPGYIALGILAKNPYLDQTLRWTFAILMGVFAIYFFSRFWVL